MTTSFADTSFFIALINVDDEYHAQAVARLKDLSSRIVSSAWVLAELGNFVARTPARSRFAALIRDLVERVKVRLIPAAQRDFEAALRLFDRRRDKEWSFVDCTSFVIMQRLDITVALTSDHHFRQAGF